MAALPGLSIVDSVACRLGVGFMKLVRVAAAVAIAAVSAALTTGCEPAYIPLPALVTVVSADEIIVDAPLCDGETTSVVGVYGGGRFNDSKLVLENRDDVVGDASIRLTLSAASIRDEAIASDAVRASEPWTSAQTLGAFGTVVLSFQAYRAEMSLVEAAALPPGVYVLSGDELREATDEEADLDWFISQSCPREP